MELNLVKIYRHGEDSSMVHLSIEANYGYGETMYTDLVQINYNGKKREAFITVKVLNPGAGAIVARMTEAITSVNYSSPKVAVPAILILETLADRLNLHYSAGEVESALSGC